MSKKNRIIASPLTPGLLGLSAAESRYATRVLRMRDGEACEVIDPWAATQGLGTLRVSGRAVSVDVSNVTAGECLGFPGLVLVQGLGKGDKTERVLRSAVALGAGEVNFVESARSVPRRVDKSSGDDPRFESVLVDTVRQCGRSNLPVVRGPIAFDAMLNEAARRSGSDVILHPNARAAPLLTVLEQCTLAAPGNGFSADHPLRLWVGPEGGLSHEEVARLDAAGGLRADLGPLVLRTELAAVAALAIVAAWLQKVSSAKPSGLSQTTTALLESKP